MDESTPHIHALVMPVERGRINVRPWTDGPERLRKMQDSYARAVEDLGLERGIRGARARHEHIQDFYRALNRDFDPDMPAPGNMESAADYAGRIEPAWKAMAARAVQAERWKARAQDLEAVLTGRGVGIGTEKTLEQGAQKAISQKQDRTVQPRTAPEKDQDLGLDF
jgi:hypothetical protein